MKKILFTVLILFLFSSGLCSQVILGPLIGLSSNSISGDAPEDVEYVGRYGFTAGLNAEFGLGKAINLFVQPRYHQRGIKIGYDIGEDEPKDSLNADINYISVPIGLKVYSGNRVVFFSGGIDLAYLMDAKAKTINPPEEESDIKDLFNKTDVSLFFGLGGNFRMGAPSVNVELRYNSGVINAYSGKGGGFGIPARFRLTNFQLLVAVNFSLTKSSKDESRGKK